MFKYGNKSIEKIVIDDLLNSIKDELKSNLQVIQSNMQAEF